MRILFVVPNVPSFIRTRPYNFIRRLSQRHQVSVLCLATNESDYRFVSDLQPYCQSLEIVRLSRRTSIRNCVNALFSATSLRCAYFYSQSLRDRVKAIVGSGEVDLVHAEHLKSMPMVEDAIGSVPAVLDAVDSISMFEQRRRSLARNPLAKVFSWIEWKRMIGEEARAAKLFDRIVISSPVDKEHFFAPADTRKKIHVVPNAVDLRHFSFRQFDTENNLIVFCGKLDYYPNADAVLFFSRAVWPLLRARRPALRFEIVGSRPPRSVLQLSGRENIHVVPSVSDVRPHLGRAALAICPIRLRAGTQFKVLEAMALGVPVVASRICCPGFAVEPGKHLLVADTPEEFVSTIELLLDNQALREKLIRAGRSFVETHHDWNHAVETLSRIYEEVVAESIKSGESVAASCSAITN
jgi:sugar transferase (PEP-CTERM/EpsH1 system associated)